MSGLNFSKFGPELQRRRLLRGNDLHHVASRIGVSVNRLRDFESGAEVPSALEAKRIFGVIHALKVFDGALVLERKLRDSKVSEPLKFHTHLISCRREANLTQKDLAELLGISEVAVGAWESGRATPVRKHYEEMLSLMPRLGDAPAPRCLDIEKPVGRGGSGTSTEDRAFAQAEKLEQRFRSETTVNQKPNDETKRHMINWSRTLMAYQNSNEKVQASMKTLLQSAHAMNFTIPELLEVLNESS